MNDFKVSNATIRWWKFMNWMDSPKVFFGIFAVFYLIPGIIGWMV